MLPQFLSELKTQDIDDNSFFLLEPLRYYSRILNGVIEVEKGFISDGSSVPRVPIIYWFFGNRAHGESVVHDRLYRAKDHEVHIVAPSGQVIIKKIQKCVADAVFLEAMEARNKSLFVRKPMYWGVKFGGLSSWVNGPDRLKFMPI